VRYELDLYIQITFIFGFKDGVKAPAVSRRIPSFDTRAIHARFTMEIVSMKQVFAPHFGSPLSVTFHQCFTSFFISKKKKILTTKTNGQAWEPSKK
jgi:hypothetical protein